MASDSDTAKSLGRGLVQINLRLNKVLELLEGNRTATASDPTLDLLLDLLDAVEQTVADAPLASPSPWWARLFPVPPRRPRLDVAGLGLARDQVRERLDALGLSPISAAGALDPVLHNVIDTRITSNPDQIGTIAATHQRGWVRRAEPPQVIRHALVTAYVGAP